MDMQNTLQRMSNIIVRPSRLEDGPLIYATWLRGLYYGNRLFNCIEKDVFFKTYPQVINKLLMTSDVSIACLTSDPDVIVGYAITQGDRLHWVYTKRSWRKMGIAKLLLSSKDIRVFTHLTDQGMMANKLNWKFNPFLT